jgi:23S rRNA (uracil1939-C5)-methyltransferase
VGQVIEVRAERMVAGGSALCRDADGRIVLVDGALPGERLSVEVEDEGDSLGQLAAVLEPVPRRVDPPCPFVAQGCGGCDWQHAAPDLQSEMRREIVTDALRRLGRLSDAVVRPGPPIGAERSRNTLRLAVDDGRLALRRRGTNDVVPVDDCLVVVPGLAELLVPGVVDPGSATEVTLRVADGTGERLLLAEPTAEGVLAPEDVAVIGADELAAGRRRWFFAEVAGHRLRVSASSFFQTRGSGAEALVAIVADQIDGAPEGTFVDLYGGVGLFAVTVAGDRRIVLVERSAAAAADARQNLAGRPAKVIAKPVERWRPVPAAVVVADPARAGLGKAGVQRTVATGAARVVLISCDAASLGRDTAALVTAGYDHVESVVVDLFGHTGHVEVVTRFDRRA